VAVRALLAGAPGLGVRLGLLIASSRPNACILEETAMDKANAIAQIDRAILRYAEVSSQSKYDDCSDLPDSVVSGLISTLAATIERVAPANGHHRKTLDKLINDFGPANPVLLPHLPGLLESLKRDYVDGHIARPEASGNMPLEAPEKVTIRWLIDHVGWGAWTTLGSLVLAAFLSGVYIGQVGWVRELLHALQAPVASDPKSQPTKITGPASTFGDNSPANTGDGNIFNKGK
jgi:hypothetical protein